MKFCKKCHKIIIKNILTKKDLGVRCRCDDDGGTLSIVIGSEIEGFLEESLTKVKRNGIKRKLVKSKISE